MHDSTEIFALVLSAIVALGLAASCGFRVFVPPLVASIAAHANMLHLSPGMQWIASTPALVCFAVATALEIAGYYIPVVDNFLDSVATPSAVVAGIIVAAAVLPDADPWLRWSLAVIAGGGAAAVVQIPTVIARGASTLTTGGIANHVVATAETVGATLFSIAAIVAPLLLPLFVFVAAYIAYRLLRTRAPQAAR